MTYYEYYYQSHQTSWRLLRIDKDGPALPDTCESWNDFHKKWQTIPRPWEIQEYLTPTPDAELAEAREKHPEAFA